MEAIFERGGGTASGGGRIVELVREACRQFSERGELFPLLFVAGDASNAIGQETNEALRELGHALKEFGKLTGRKCERTDGEHGAAGDAERFHSGKGQDTGDVSGAAGKNGAVLQTVLAPGP